MRVHDEAIALLRRALDDAWTVPRLVDAIASLPDNERRGMAALIGGFIMVDIDRRRAATGLPATPAVAVNPNRP